MKARHILMDRKVKIGLLGLGRGVEIARAAVATGKAILDAA